MMSRFKKEGTLANIILRNYILTYFIITILLTVIIIVNLSIGLTIYLNDEKLQAIDANRLMKDDYTEIDSSTIEKLGGFLEVVDKNNEVIYRRGENPNNIGKYSPYEYNKLYSAMEKLSGSYGFHFSISLNRNLEIQNNENYNYDCAYNANKEFLLITAVPKSAASEYIKDNNKINSLYLIILFIVLDFGVLVLGFFILSRSTSKILIKPLNQLLKGVKEITNGNYSTRIKLKSTAEFMELKDAFNHMSEEIEKERYLKEMAEEKRKNLILDISHDLKNPLSSILGYSEYILKSSTLEKEELKNYLETIYQNSHRANNLIEDLFEYSRLESDTLKLNLKSNDICEFLRTLIAGYIPMLEDKKFNYDMEIPEKKILLLFDDKNLDRALSNIIVNAIKYNPENTELKIKASVEEKYFIIIIEDNGIGIPKEDSKDIFDAFVRVEKSRNSKKGGTGLGLAIAKNIIKRHGGSIELESSLKVGSKFIIKLPIN